LCKVDYQFPPLAVSLAPSELKISKQPYICSTQIVQGQIKNSRFFERIAAAAGCIAGALLPIGGFVRDKIIGRPTKDADISLHG
jgi:hypothetical protein